MLFFCTGSLLTPPFIIILFTFLTTVLKDQLNGYLPLWGRTVGLTVHCQCVFNHIGALFGDHACNVLVSVL